VATLMTPVLYMVAVSLGSSLLATLLLGDVGGPEIVLGMLAPLAAVTVTWLLIERMHGRNPAGVTALMVRTFAVKLVFFGTYAVVVVGVLGYRPLAFLVSFTCYFLALYGSEAVLLHRLSTRSLGSPG
jgi:hypothetical protein